MDNYLSSEFKQAKNKSKGELILERNKVISHCINLECKNEQLKVLIDKLHKIASEREELISENKIKRIFNSFDYLKSNKSKILSELTEAIRDKDKLENKITNLKSKILIINEFISKE